jgi:hypothetical protein
MKKHDTVHRPLTDPFEQLFLSALVNHPPSLPVVLARALTEMM